MCKFSVIFVIVFTLILSGMTQAASIDVTTPGDTVKGVPDDGDWPGGEPPPMVIDNNVDTKYLHRKGGSQTTGFQVTPSLGGMIVTGLTFTTANDSAGRDPVTFELYGSNDFINGPNTLIASGDIVDFNQPTEWPRKTKNETPISFDNDVAYDHYEVLFTALRGAEPLMQIAEVELLATVTLPTMGSYKDIDTSGGDAWEDNGTYVIRASGADIWGSSDSFGYLFRPLDDDGVMDVNLVSMTSTHEWQKAGLMIRETTDAGSTHFMIAVSGTHGIQACWRTETNGGTDGVATEDPEHVPPQLLRIKREGSLITGEYYGWILKPIKKGWKSFASQTITMNAQVYVGLVVCSLDNGQLCTAVFDNVLWPAEPYNKAWLLSPADGTDNTSLAPTLTWLPGDSAVEHQVLMGTDPADLSIVATLPLGEESYTPAALEEATTYYWQIVEQPGDYAGPVLSFSTYALPVGLEACVWFGIGGVAVSDLMSDPRYPYSPDGCELWTITHSETMWGTTDWANDYGARLQGMLWPETSGDYTFWIASDDASQLWLSPTGNPGDAEMICQETGCCDDYNDDQKSVPIYLEGGQMYYFRALWKEGGGGDWVKVAWQGPDAPDRTEITSYYFSQPLEAQNPVPEDGSLLTPLEVTTLEWFGETRIATSQDVYFGEDPGAMTLFTTVPGGTNTIDAPPLDADKTYYWQVKRTDGTDVYEGPVWSFSIAEWVSIDIGRANPEPAGSSSFDPNTGVYTLKSGGNELWGGADEFHFLYMTMKMARDTGEIKARVLSIDAPDSWRRAGVMIRESTAANASKVMAHKTGHNNTRMQWRDNTGAGTGGGPEYWDLGFPMWVRVTRKGNQFNGYYSQDGENWSHLGSRNVTMTNDYVCVGLAMCHHNSQPQDQLSTGMFDSLSITTPDPLQSWEPSPSNGAEGVPINVVLSWNAGEGATLQHLYFSDNYADVEDGTAYIGEFDVDVTEYDAGVLDLTKTYYWAVDMEVRVGRDYETILGEIWSFTIEEFLVIEDFEAYDDPPVPLEDPPEQVVIDPGYTIPGYTIEAVEPDAGCLIAEWAFEGNYDDTSGSGFHGTPVGDANIVNDATRGDVLSLDGDLDYVNCGNPAALNFSTGDWSLSAWVKNTMTGTGDDNKGSIIANGGDTGGGHRYCLILTEQQEGEVTLVVDDDSDKRQARGDATKVNDGVWHHVLGVRDGDTIRIYIDGVEEGSAGLPAGYDLSGTVQHDVLIGAITDHPDGNDIYKDYGGLIDDVQIYDCALTEGNARYLAEVGDKVVDPIVTPPTYGPLIAEYLVELPDPTADTSGNNIHGTPLGDVDIVDDAERGLVASFDGNGDAVDIGDNERFNPGADDFSISVWVNLNSWGGSWGNVIVGKRGEGGVGWQLRRFGGDPRFSWTTRGMGNDDYPRSDQTIAMNQWYHLAAIRDGDQKRLYIDGMLESTQGINTNPVNACDHKVYIGARANGGNTGPESFFDGMIDDLRIYNYALTWGQVLNLAEYTPTNPITDTWSGTPMTEYGIAHGGNASMRMEYDNSQYVYQALSRRDAPFADWTAGNAKALSMWFRGDPGNAADLAIMYVTLQDDSESASVYYDGDRSDLNKAEWQEWNIAMDDLAGVNADSIGNIEVGVVGLGGPGNPGGQMYFDDMRLYPPRCIPEYGPLADLTDDCIVDMRDLRVLVGDWLVGDETSTGLVARFEFDGDLTDSSGNGNHGTAFGAVGFETDAVRGEVLDLPGGDDQYVGIPPVGISGRDPTTIACWAKADNTSIPDWTLVFGFTGTAGSGGGGGSHFNIGSLGGPGGVGAHVWGWEATIFTDDEALEWRHYAMTYDGTTVKYYGDAVPVGTVDFDLSTRADRVHVGSRVTQASSFPGNVDDARIYRRALSDDDIVAVMGGGDPAEAYFPLVSIANIYDEEPINSKKVNLKDYATMAEDWLVEVLFP